MQALNKIRRDIFTLCAHSQKIKQIILTPEYFFYFNKILLLIEYSIINKTKPTLFGIPVIIEKHLKNDYKIITTG